MKQVHVFNCEGILAWYAELVDSLESLCLQLVEGVVDPQHVLEQLRVVLLELDQKFCGLVNKKQDLLRYNKALDRLLVGHYELDQSSDEKCYLWFGRRHF